MLYTQINPYTQITWINVASSNTVKMTLLLKRIQQITVFIAEFKLLYVNQATRVLIINATSDWLGAVKWVTSDPSIEVKTLLIL